MGECSVPTYRERTPGSYRDGTRIREAAARQKIASGLHVFSIEDAKRRIEEGWQFVALNSELKFMMQGASEVANAFASGSNPSDVAKY